MRKETSTQKIRRSEKAKIKRQEKLAYEIDQEKHWSFHKKRDASLETKRERMSEVRAEVNVETEIFLKAINTFLTEYVRFVQKDASAHKTFTFMLSVLQTFYQ